MVARGGRGGLGNTHFKTSTHQAPKHAQKGEPGSEGWIRLELRLIADIGLVGLPNAGKSTILAAVTAATPKIADYPFTTLEPNLGVMELAEGDDRRPTIADVPGLIEGASSGAGLGHAFLRHVERTRILVHVVDGSSRDPEWDYDVIREELRAHDPALLDKPMLVAFNKIDLPAAAEAWPAFQRARAAEGVDVLAISAAAGEGLAAFRTRIADVLPDAADLAEPPEPAGVVVHRIDTMGDGFSVELDTDGAFRVRGARIERIAAQTNFDVEESAERFQRALARFGIDTELRRSGVAPAIRSGSAAPSSNGRRNPGADVSGPIGIFGGTFDPIHIAHLAVAEEAAEALGLERVVFVPAGIPPHKPDRAITAGEHRLAMVELAIAGNARFTADRRELDRPGRSYTVDTLEALRRRDAVRARAHHLGRLVPGSHVVAGAAAHPRAGTARRRAARRLSGGRPGLRWPPNLPDRADRATFLDGPHLHLSAQRVAGARGGGAIAAVSRAGCGRGLHQRPWALHRPQEDSDIVTEPATPAATDSAPSADGLPHRAKAAPAAERPPLELARRIVELAEDKKAADIVLLDLAGLTTMADYFVICSGGSERQLEAIATGSSAASGTSGPSRSAARARRPRTGSWSTSAR